MLYLIVAVAADVIVTALYLREVHRGPLQRGLPPLRRSLLLADVRGGFLLAGFLGMHFPNVNRDLENNGIHDKLFRKTGMSRHLILVRKPFFTKVTGNRLVLKLCFQHLLIALFVMSLHVTFEIIWACPPKATIVTTVTELLGVGADLVLP